MTLSKTDFCKELLSYDDTEDSKMWVKVTIEGKAHVFPITLANLIVQGDEVIDEEATAGVEEQDIVITVG